MTEEELAKLLSKSILDNDKRPYAPGEKEAFKKLIDDSESPNQLLIAIIGALSHPFSS